MPGWNIWKKATNENLKSRNLTCICRHLLLGYENFFWSVDDEITAGIKRTFVQLCQITIRQSVEQAVGGSKHYRDFPDERFLVMCFDWIFTFSCHFLFNVNVKWCRISGLNGMNLFRLTLSLPVMRIHINFPCLQWYAGNERVESQTSI